MRTIKEFLFVGTCFVFLLTTGCKTSKNAISGSFEDFDQFYDRFHLDETFQMSRIIFPLEGSSEDASGERTWTPENWMPLKVKIYDVDTSVYKVEYSKNNDSFIQRFWLPGTGFKAEYRFQLKDGKWYLVYASDSNL